MLAPLAQVCQLENPGERDKPLAAINVTEVWGVGWRLGEQLCEGGIHTALDLARLDPATARRRWFWRVIGGGRQL